MCAETNGSMLSSMLIHANMTGQLPAPEAMAGAGSPPGRSSNTEKNSQACKTNEKPIKACFTKTRDVCLTAANFKVKSGETHAQGMAEVTQYLDSVYDE